MGRKPVCGLNLHAKSLCNQIWQVIFATMLGQMTIISKRNYTCLAFVLQKRPVRFVANFFRPLVILSKGGDEFVVLKFASLSR